MGIPVSSSFSFQGYSLDTGWVNRFDVPGSPTSVQISSGGTAVGTGSLSILDTASNPFNTTSGSRLVNCLNAAVATSLATGEAVGAFSGISCFLYIDPAASSSVQLGATYDHVSRYSIAILSGFSAPGTPLGMTLAIDNSDNLYVVSGSGTSIAVQAFSHISGGAWTQQTLVTGGAQGSTWKGFTAGWCNTGGGTNGAGHLLILANDGTNIGYWVLDAGKALTGTATGLVVTNGLNPAWTGSSTFAGSNLDLAWNGMGASSGLSFCGNTSTSATVGTWSISSAGAVTASSLGTVTCALSATTRLRCLWSYLNVWTLCYPLSTGDIGILCASSSALQSNAVRTTTAGQFPQPGATLKWDAVSTGTTAWLIAYGFVGQTSWGTTDTVTQTVPGVGTETATGIPQSAVALLSASVVLLMEPINIANPAAPAVGIPLSQQIAQFKGSDYALAGSPYQTNYATSGQSGAPSGAGPVWQSTFTYNELHALTYPNNNALCDVWWWGSLFDQLDFATAGFSGGSFVPTTIVYSYTGYFGCGQAVSLVVGQPTPAWPQFGALLLLPAMLAAAYLAGGATFSWQFESTLTGDSQTGYYFQRTHSTTTEYWTGSGWSSTPTLISSSAQSIVFGAGQWATSTTYTWAVQVVNSQGLPSGFSATNTVVSTPATPTAPTLTATASASGNSVSLTATSTYASAGLLLIQRSTDGGTTWAAVRAANGAAITASGMLTVTDYEAPPNSTISYRAAVADATWGAYGTFSSTQTATLPAITAFWLRDPLALTAGINPNVKPGSLKTGIAQSAAVHAPLGRTNPVVLRDVFHGEDGSVTFWTYSDTDETNLRALLLSGHTLLFQTPEQHQYYGQFILPELGKGGGGGGQSNNFDILRPYPGTTNRYKDHPVTWVAVDVP